MKKSFLLINVICFLFITSVKAQFDQGMAHVGFGIFAQPGVSSVQITTRANIGYFIMDNVSVGLMPHYNRTVRSRGNDLTQVVSNSGVSIFGRYYFTFPFSDKFAVFPEVSLGPGYRGFKGNHSVSLNLSAGAGVNYFLTDNITVELVLPLVHQRSFSSDDVFDYSSIAPVLGIQYHF